jgi:hypothetical protein
LEVNFRGEGGSSGSRSGGVEENGEAVAGVAEAKSVIYSEVRFPVAVEVANADCFGTILCGEINFGSEGGGGGSRGGGVQENGGGIAVRVRYN